jgi:hypothetical protein
MSYTRFGHLGVCVSVRLGLSSFGEGMKEGKGGEVGPCWFVGDGVERQPCLLTGVL